MNVQIKDEIACNHNYDLDPLFKPFFQERGKPCTKKKRFVKRFNLFFRT
jgi:hypothetical protein